MGFIKARLNKDNFWNLMFWFGMSSGISSSLSLGEINAALGGVLFCITVIFVPLIIKGCSEVEYIGNKVFLNSKGESLAGKYPKRLGIVIILAIAVTVATGFITGKCFDLANGNVSTIISTSILFLIPTLYFIYKNCTVSILFNKYAWHVDSGTGFYQKGYTPLPNQTASIFPTSSEYRYSPIYSYRSDNIHNKSTLYK